MQSLHHLHTETDRIMTTTWLQARYHHLPSSMDTENDLKAGCFNLQTISLSLTLGMNARSFHSSVYVWKESLSTGGRLTRIRIHLVLKYRPGCKYTSEIITTPICHTCRIMSLFKLGLTRTTYTRLIDWIPILGYQTEQESMLYSPNSHDPCDEAWHTTSSNERLQKNRGSTLSA